MLSYIHWYDFCDRKIGKRIDRCPLKRQALSPDASGDGLEVLHLLMRLMLERLSLIFEDVFFLSFFLSFYMDCIIFNKTLAMESTFKLKMKSWLCSPTSLQYH